MRVRTVDDALALFRARDLGAGIGHLPKGTEIQLGSLFEFGGREWLEVLLQSGEKAYVLSASVRGHAVEV